MARIDVPEQARTDDQRLHRTDGRSLVDLVKELRDESSHLIRQEVALAKAEMSEKAAHYGRNTGYLVGGAALATTGVMFLALSGMIGIYNGLVEAGLSHAAAGWIAPLITAVVVLGVGYFLVQKAINAIKNESPVPERTVDSLQHDRDWIKEKVQK